jgi:glycerol uptake facilitator-like aquaporin
MQLTPTLRRALFAEALGSAFLLAVVVGSGIMGERLSGGNVAIALLANSLATGAGLFVLIVLFGPISGAHFNPAVSLVALLRGELGRAGCVLFIGAQLVGAVAGVWAAHAMFGIDVLQSATHQRSGGGQWWSEFVATFGLLLTILGASRKNDGGKAPSLALVAAMVGLYIVAAYWFTGSTSFANPAVTVARGLSDTFAGIRPVDVGGFILAQIGGALCAAGCARYLFQNPLQGSTPENQ